MPHDALPQNQIYRPWASNIATKVGGILFLYGQSRIGTLLDTKYKGVIYIWGGRGKATKTVVY